MTATPAAAADSSSSWPRERRAAVRGIPARAPLASWLVAGFVALKLAIHIATTVVTHYGIHRDEYLYLAMGRHLRLWRMDFPPFIAIVAEGSRALFGDTLLAVRIAPALAGAALVVLAALLARELGGARRAQGLAMLAMLCSPLFLRTSTLFQPVVFDQLWWTLGYLALARICRVAIERGSSRAAALGAAMGPDAREARLWLLLGVACGLGLLTKFTIAFFGLGVLAAILVSPLRGALRTPWPWLSFLLALVLGSPSIVGQILLDFPVVGQMADLQRVQLARIDALDFLSGQILFGPIVLLAAAGLFALLFDRRLRAFRAVGIACIATFVLLLLGRGKAYYAGPIYPVLLAAGAAWLDVPPRPRFASLLQWTTAALLVAYGVLTLPIGLPILPPRAMAEYAQRLGVGAVTRTNVGTTLALPQDYADMLGWEAQARAVARVYHALPPEQREDAVVLGDNYGESGALDFHGRALGLPPAISPAGSFWFFGPGEKPGRVIVTIGVDSADLAEYYDSVRVADRVTHRWAVEEEQDIEVLVGTQPRATLQEIWPGLAGQN